MEVACWRAGESAGGVCDECLLKRFTLAASTVSRLLRALQADRAASRAHCPNPTVPTHRLKCQAEIMIPHDGLPAFERLVGKGWPLACVQCAPSVPRHG